jgi:hypothetical protein
MHVGNGGTAPDVNFQLQNLATLYPWRKIPPILSREKDGVDPKVNMNETVRENSP